MAVHRHTALNSVPLTIPIGTACIFPPERFLGLEREEHFVFTTGGKVGGNGPLDVDVCLCTLTKWAGLAAKGNPSAFHFLFMQLQFTTNTWDYFTARPEIFLAKGHVEPFLGFANDQMKRLLGQKGQKNVHRAELETKFGYDTKYAMHIVRRYGEAKELMESGRITLPRPHREELIEIRLGKYTLAEIRELSLQLEGLHRPRRHFPMRWAGMPLIGFSPILTFDFGALVFFGILVRLSCGCRTICGFQKWRFLNLFFSF